jgi:uncharacterized membrane protein
MHKLAIAFLFGTLAFGQVASDPASRIAQALRAHQYEQAVKLARAALKHAPNDFGILTMEAIALSVEGEQLLDFAPLWALDRRWTIQRGAIEQANGQGSFA